MEEERDDDCGVCYNRRTQMYQLLDEGRVVFESESQQEVYDFDQAWHDSIFATQH